jgi:hypothetical protein
MLFVRKQHLGFGWVASLLMLTGAASLGAAVVIQSNRLSELTSDRQLLLRDATRIRAVDALIGQRLPEDWMDGLALHPSGAIVWVVTPRSCPGCLSDLQAWNALAKRGVPTRLVLIGVDDSEARVIAARSRIASAVTVVPGTPLSNGLSCRRRQRRWGARPTLRRVRIFRTSVGRGAQAPAVTPRTSSAVSSRRRRS